MKTTTFYSYKGGLGRTLLVAWVARQLERDGHSVVALDLDLEAPGLHYKLGFARDADLGPGLVELLARFQRGDPPPDSLREWLRPVPGAQRLWLLPAGPVNTRDYLRALGVVSWEGLFRGESPQGPRFFTWLKESIASDPAPDHLVIDARTGITEMGGAALGVMADQALAIVGLSLEGLDGTRDVLQSVCSFARSVPKDPPRMGLVLSRVPWTGTDEQHQSLRVDVRDKIERASAELNLSLSVGLPLVVRSESALQLDERMALADGRLEVHDDYDAIRDWINGTPSPDAPPPAFFPVGADSETLRTIVALKRGRAGVGEVGSLAELAQALQTYSAAEESGGRKESALAATQEAVGLYRELARARPDAFTPHLAKSLHNLSVRLSNLGRREEALTAVEEATALRRELANTRPGLFMSDLALSLGSLSVHLASLGRREDALATVEEATALHRGLSRERPDVFTPSLAATLNIYSNRLSELGRHEEALAAVEEATALYRELAHVRPGVFSADLAASLNNLGLRLGQLGRREDALAALLESTTLRRDLAREKPHAFLPSLAGSLNNLSNRLAELDQHAGALAAAQEATSLYRDLARAWPDTFTPELATSLNNLSGHLSKLSRNEDALAVIHEATALRRELARARPDAFIPDLSSSLNNLSLRLSDLSRHNEALAASAEALRIIRGPLERWGLATAQKAEWIRETYIECCKRVGVEPDSHLLSPISAVLDRIEREREAS